MNYGCNERQEKYGEHLGMDTLFDLFFVDQPGLEPGTSRL